MKKNNQKAKERRAWLARECLRTNIPERESFEKEIRDKKVIIVIPSASLLKKNQGENIDKNYDTVIRIGHGYETDGLEEYIGTKTDAIYHGLRRGRDIKTLSLDLVESYGVKNICCLSSGAIFLRCKRYERKAKRKDIRINFNYRSPIGFTLKNFSKNLKRTKPNFRPLQGVAAIADLIATEPKELTICGADFYETGHQPNYDIRDYKLRYKEMRFTANRFHNLQRNKVYTAELILSRPNIFIDKITFESLVRNKYIRRHIKEKLQERVVEV